MSEDVPATPPDRPPLQPALHALVLTLRAPTVVASGQDGQLRGTGAQGVLHADVRALSTAVLTVNGEEPEPVSFARTGPDTARFTGLLRRLGDDGPDPSVRVDRVRSVAPGRVGERLVVGSTASGAVAVQVLLDLSSDHVAMDLVKHGLAGEPVPAEVGGDVVRWAADGVTSTVRAPGAVFSVRDGGATACWTATIAPRGALELSWELEVVDTGGVVGPAPGALATTPVVRADDRRLGRWFEASLADLDALRMVRTEHPGDAFAAAGAPWYLTLFGRDSIWAARMALPLGTDLAAGTLRALAGLQGTEHDAPTQQQPGKIMHELRRAATVLGSGTHLPPVYYGTVDATPLFVCLLHDAWRWGMPEDEVRALVPAARAALDWVVRWGDADGDGLLEYVDTEGTGLANQGWKDSGDSVRFADGRQATAPIALAEVQGYAHEALLHGADLLAAFGDDDVDGYREVAARLRQRFADAFWVDGDGRAVPGAGAGRRQDQGRRRGEQHGPPAGHRSALARRRGAGRRRAHPRRQRLRPRPAHHVVEVRRLRRRSATTAARCGRTTPPSRCSPSPGPAWARAGRGLLSGLVEAAEAFGYRLPELWSGDALAEVGRPVPYPAACHPQAWSVTSAVAVVQVLLGLQVDVPAGVATLRPLRPSPVGAVRVEGLVVAGEPCTVEVDADGEVRVAEGAGLRWDVVG